MRRFSSVALTFVVAVTASCGSGEEGGPDLASIEVTPTPVSLAQAQTAQLQVSVLNSQGQLVTGIPVTFTSGDANIATVSNTGLVTAVRAGSTDVTVRADDLTREVEVTVTAVSDEIVLSPSPGVVPQNATLQITATVFDLSGLPIPGAPVAWSSSNPGLATVSATGLVDPVGAAGQVIVTAQSGTLVSTATVAITQVPTTLVTVPNPLRMGKSGAIQLSAQVRDLVGAPINGVNLTYTSGNPTLATVSASGLVEGKGIPGMLSITVAGGGLTNEVPVTLVDVGSPAGVLEGTSPISGTAYGIAISPGGTIVVTGSQVSRASLTNRSFSVIVPDQLTEFVYAPALALQGNSAWVSGLPLSGISEIDATTGESLGEVTGLTGRNYFQLQFSADGSRLYAAGSGGFVVINPATRAVERDVVVPNSGLTMVLNPVGTTVFVGGYGTLVEVTPSTGTMRNVTDGGYTNFAISPDGQTAYLVDEFNAAVTVMSVATGAVGTPIALPCAPWGIGMAPDGTKLVASCGASILLVDVLARAVLQNFSVGGQPRRVAFSQDGLTAAVTNTDLGVHFIR